MNALMNTRNLLLDDSYRRFSSFNFWRFSLILQTRSYLELA